MKNRRITRQGAARRLRLGLSADDEHQTPDYHGTGGHGRQDKDHAEEEEERQEGFQRNSDAEEQSKLPSLAAHFAALTNAVLQRITDGKTSDNLYDEFMQRAKMQVVRDLKEAYDCLHYFYKNPLSLMPTWLSTSPPARKFHTCDMDVRLDSRLSQIKQELISFLEEQGFVPPKIDYLGALGSIIYPFFSVHLRLDVTTVPTKKAREHDDPKELPTLAAHFAALTNVVLQRMTDGKPSDKLYDEFMQRAKTKIVRDLKETYDDLHYFYRNPLSPMPTWLSTSPPGKKFYTSDMDVRLHSRLPQIKQELSSFSEEQGFVPPKIHYFGALGNMHPFISVHLLLDVTTVLTKKGREYADPKEQFKLPTLAADFAALTNTVLQRMMDGETSDNLYDEFMQGAKTKIVRDLKETYDGLHYFYRSPLSPMPTWLSTSPPGRKFHTSDIDVRLHSRLPQIKQELSSFLEEQGFVPPKIHYFGALGNMHPFISVHLQLDVARVSTKTAREQCEEKLRKLRIAFG